MMKESYGRDGLHGEEFSLVNYLTLLDGWVFVKEFKGERNVCV